MLLEPISLNGKPQGKCFAKKCDECAFYRKWQLLDEKTMMPRIETKCSWESIFFNLPKIIGSIHGCQEAVNEARNRAMETKASVSGLVNGLIEMSSRKAIGQ